MKAKSTGKQQNEAADISTGTQETEPSQQPVLAELEARLKAAEAEAAPILATIWKYEREIAALKHELRDVTHAPMGGVEGGVLILVPKHDLSPEERLEKEKSLAEKERHLAEWEKKLGPSEPKDTVMALNYRPGQRTTAKVERLQRQLKDAHERVEEHLRKIAALESSDSDKVAMSGFSEHSSTPSKGRRELREYKTLAEEAVDLEIARQAAIAKERAELRELMGSES
ncbi:MAG: hypothetical protein WBZ42_03565 [Halobacteriota archaeon]